MELAKPRGATLPADAWERVVIDAARARNRGVFDMAVGLVAGIVGDDDREFFANFSRDLAGPPGSGSETPDMGGLQSRLDAAKARLGGLGRDGAA